MKKILALVMVIVTLMTIVLPINSFAANEFTDLNESEPNDSLQTANAINNYESYEGTSNIYDVDYFEFFLEYDSNVRITSFPYITSYFQVVLCDKFGTTIITGESHSGHYILIEDTIPGGTYYIKVTSNQSRTYDYSVALKYDVVGTTHTHQYDEEVWAPTCTEGYTIYTCKCGDSYVSDYVPAVHAFDETGLLCTFCGYEVGKENGWIYETDGNWHCYENGAVVTNKWVKDDNGWRYADKNGCALRNTWQKDSAGWCYLGDDGYMLTSQWVADSAGLCYVNASGYMVTSKWIKDEKGWCYVNGGGHKVYSKWVKDSKGWCYVAGDGYMAYNKWVKDSKGWCYVGSNGYMVYNKWVKDSTGWCYVGANGYMTYNKWVKDSKGWCYVGSNGYMTVSKWVKDDGSWYYMDSDGYMTTGYAKIDGNFYYFYNSGKMLANTTHGSAYVNSSGIITGANFAYLAGDDFRTERNQYQYTQARCAYVYPYFDTTDSFCVMTVVFYRLGNLDYKITTTHDFGRNKTIKEPYTHYSNLADRYYGATKVQYMTLASNASLMETKALEEGYYLPASHAEFK